MQIIFGSEMVRNAFRNAFLNTLTIGTAFPFEMAPGLSDESVFL